MSVNIIRCDICDNPIKREYFVAVDVQGGMGRLHQTCLNQALEANTIRWEGCSWIPHKISNHYRIATPFPTTDRINKQKAKTWPRTYFGD